MRLPPRPVRRLLLPLEVAVLVVLAAGFAVATVIGAVIAPFGPRRRLLRTAAFGCAYCSMELVVLTAAGALWLRHPRPTTGAAEDRRVASHQALLAWALGLVLGAARRCFGFEVVVADGPEPAALTGTGPVLVLARHGGPGDSFALVHLLLTRYHRGVRVVLKEILQLDPVLDVLLNRLGCCFLPSRGGAGEDLAERMADLARELGPRDALLVFPEGGNWTPERRRRVIRRLRADDKSSAARTATLMTHVLPPRPAGVLACLEARPRIDVVLMAHAGLDRVVRVRQAWDRLPLTTPMTVRAWPAAPVPEGEDARLTWLTTEWATLDEWVDAYHADPADPPG